MGSVNDSTIYSIEARVARALLVDRFALQVAGIRIDDNPPAAGPEVALHWRISALSGTEAEESARRRLLEDFGLTTLALVARD